MAQLSKPFDFDTISQRVNYLLTEVKKLSSQSYLPLSGGTIDGTLKIGPDVEVNLASTNEGNQNGGGSSADTYKNLIVNGKLIVKRVPFSNHKTIQWNEGSGLITFDNSSRRYKTDIKPLYDDFHKILELEPKTYIRPKHIYLPSEAHLFTGKREIGYIAEELDELGLKNIVWYNQEGLPDGINYEKMAVCYFQPLIKELFKRVEDLENQMSGKRKKVKMTR